MEQLPDGPALPPTAALAFAQRLIEAGSPFQAHEVLEASWKAAPAAERELWRGLAQIAVGLTHARRGNDRGATALLRRGALRVSRHPDRHVHGLDLDAVTGQAEGLAILIEQAGAEAALASGSRFVLYEARDR